MFCVSEEGFVFQQGAVYDRIEMICIMNDDGKAKWRWIDYSNVPYTELPECVVS